MEKHHHQRNCQAQFKSSPSPVQLELRLALSLINTTPTHPHPPGKVEVQLESGHIWSVGSRWKLSGWLVCDLGLLGSGYLIVVGNHQSNVANLSQSKPQFQL